MNPPAVPGKPGRRWVAVGTLPADANEVALSDFLGGLEKVGVLALDKSREYRLAWDAKARRWELSVR